MLGFTGIRELSTGLNLVKPSLEGLTHQKNHRLFLFRKLPVIPSGCGYPPDVMGKRWKMTVGVLKTKMPTSAGISVFWNACWQITLGKVISRYTRKKMPCFLCTYRNCLVYLEGTLYLQIMLKSVLEKSRDITPTPYKWEGSYTYLMKDLTPMSRCKIPSCNC